MANNGAAVLCEVLRKKVMCGHCKSSTFVLWRSHALAQQQGTVDRAMATEKITAAEVPGLQEETVVAYTVRCAFFRQNVPNPHRLLFCEGYKSP